VGGLPEQPLDDAVFGKLARLDAEEPGFLAELLDDFHAGVRARFRSMRRALHSGDRDALLLAAHGMRGSCGTLGALRMAVLALTLESAVERGAGTAVTALVRQLEAEYDAVSTALAGLGTPASAQ